MKHHVSLRVTFAHIRLALIDRDSGEVFTSLLLRWPATTMAWQTTQLNAVYHTFYMRYCHDGRRDLFAVPSLPDCLWFGRKSEATDAGKCGAISGNVRAGTDDRADDSDNVAPACTDITNRVREAFFPTLSTDCLELTTEIDHQLRLTASV